MARSSCPSTTADEGPPDGLTLDQAIELLVQQNLDLRAKYLEIPQARADVLTASLRANPDLLCRRPARPLRLGLGSAAGRAHPIRRERIAPD